MITFPRFKSALIGFSVGVLLVFVAAFGVIFGFIEFLQPLLSPGTEMLRGSAEDLPINPFILGLFLNGIIYGLLFHAIAYVKQVVTDKTNRYLIVSLVLLIFIILTGMFSAIVEWIQSPDKWWIFNVGA